MIDLYTWGTPNGKKVSIMLEEVDLPYEVHPINLGKKDQFRPEYLEINPNNKIPTLVDRDGPGGKPFTLFESGAILIYLADKTGKLLSQEPRARYEAIQWLMFQMGGIGPIFGQAHHFFGAQEKVPYAIDRFRKETLRLYAVMEKHLASHDFFVNDYSIADIATYPWVGRYERHQVNLNDFPNVKRWFDAITARPAVQRGLAIPKV
ncbi:MAG: glutathione S-transferase family protein [Candidatus Binatia bacterium]